MGAVRSLSERRNIRRSRQRAEEAVPSVSVGPRGNVRWRRKAVRSARASTLIKPYGEAHGLKQEHHNYGNREEAGSVAPVYSAQTCRTVMRSSRIWSGVARLVLRQLWLSAV